MTRACFRPVAVSVIFALLVGCATTRSAYYNAWEKFGYAKRERLVDNVKAARQEQVEAKQQFASALEQFKSVVKFQGGDLEAMYNKLNKQYEGCESQAEQVNSKVAAVKNVAGALFTEWRGEIKEIKDDPSLQRQSQSLYDRTQQSYQQMIDRMDSAAATMQPVLTRFKNRVLFIKHNLNAQAIASLQGTEVELGGDIDKLIKEMEKSIAEADAFISQIQTKKT
ncbi:MAG TPA: DUF2959 domain-containing protein [Tepidisphaeraceae bacterium]